MSRAFTREIDDAPAPPRPDRLISDARNLVTRRGAALIEDQVRKLDRRLDGTPNPSELEDLRREQRYWLARRATMQIVEPSGDVVGLAQGVVIKRAGRKLTLRIVGEDEAEPAAGRIAWTSPLARALEGARGGEAVEFAAAGRTEAIEVVAVDSAGETSA